MKKIKIELCTGTSCHLMGALDISVLMERLKREYGDKIEISLCTCLGNCGKGPNLKMNEEVIVNIKPDKLEKIIRQKLQLDGGDNDETCK